MIELGYYCYLLRVEWALGLDLCGGGTICMRRGSEDTIFEIGDVAAVGGKMEGLMACGKTASRWGRCLKMSFRVQG